MNDLRITARFVKNISFNLTQFVSWILLVTAMIILLSFSEMITSYETFFIDKLKSVYPNVFLYTAKKKINPINNQVSHEKEIFEIIWDSFDYSYDKKKSQTTANISLRSFSSKHIPNVLNEYRSFIKNKEDIIYINRKFYNKITMNTEYKNILYLKSYIDRRFYGFTIKPFDMYDETEWILIPNYIAHKLFHDSMFGHTVIYSDVLKESEVYNLYSQKYEHLFLWSDKVPLFSRASLAILKSAFSVIIFTTLILTISTIFIVLKSIIDEYVLYTTQVLIFGINVYKLFILYLILFFTYISSILIPSYFVITYIKQIIGPIISVDMSTDMITSLGFLISISFIISLFILFGLFKYVFNLMKKRELN
jgi:hypothetical protein